MQPLPQLRAQTPVFFVAQTSLQRKFERRLRLSISLPILARSRLRCHRYKHAALPYICSYGSPQRLGSANNGTYVFSNTTNPYHIADVETEGNTDAIENVKSELSFIAFEDPPFFFD